MNLNLQICLVTDSLDPETSPIYAAAYKMLQEAISEFQGSGLASELFYYFNDVATFNYNVFTCLPSITDQVTFNKLPAILFINQDTEELISLIKLPYTKYIIQRTIQFSYVEMLKKQGVGTDGFHSQDPLFSIVPVTGDESVVFHGIALPITNNLASGGILDDMIRNIGFWWEENKDKFMGWGVLAAVGFGIYKLNENDSNNGKKRR